jgi:transcriptional regulator with XRE-family HTH domain
VRRRLVGGALRRYRENVGYALEDAARVLECDRSKISRIETGQRGIRPKELRELLTEYGVPDGEQAALVAIASRGGQRGWWQPYADVLPAPYLDYVIMESAAAEIMTYEAQVVPDLLQTEEYARAIAAAEPGYATDQQREEAVAAKATRRQVVLGASAGRRMSVILGEAALHQAVGGPGTMAGQISHLVRLVDDLPGLTLQVLPFAAGAHAAAGSASLAILRFPDAPSLGVVYLEALSGGVYLESQEDVARYIRAFALLRAAALSAADSARLLSGIQAEGAFGLTGLRVRGSPVGALSSSGSPRCGSGGAVAGSRLRACRRSPGCPGGLRGFSAIARASRCPGRRRHRYRWPRPALYG